MNGRRRERSAYRAEADDSERLALDLGARELRLFLLDELRYVRVVLYRLYPVYAADNVTAGEEHSAYGELLDAVRVRSRGVENDDALLSAPVERDIVDAGAGSGDCLKSSGPNSMSCMTAERTIIASGFSQTSDTV